MPFFYAQKHVLYQNFLRHKKRKGLIFRGSISGLSQTKYRVDLDLIRIELVANTNNTFRFIRTKIPMKYTFDFDCINKKIKNHLKHVNMFFGSQFDFTSLGIMFVTPLTPLLGPYRLDDSDQSVSKYRTLRVQFELIQNHMQNVQLIVSMLFQLVRDHVSKPWPISIMCPTSAFDFHTHFPHARANLPTRADPISPSQRSLTSRNNSVTRRWNPSITRTSHAFRNPSEQHCRRYPVTIARHFSTRSDRQRAGCSLTCATATINHADFSHGKTHAKMPTILHGSGARAARNARYRMTFARRRRRRRRRNPITRTGPPKKNQTKNQKKNENPNVIRSDACSIIYHARARETKNPFICVCVCVVWPPSSGACDLITISARIISPLRSSPPGRCGRAAALNI